MSPMGLIKPRVARSHVMYEVFAAEPSEPLVAAFDREHERMPADLMTAAMVIQTTGARFRTWSRQGEGVSPPVARLYPDMLVQTTGLLPADVQRLAASRVCYGFEAIGAPAQGLLGAMGLKMVGALAELVGGIIHDGVACTYLRAPEGDWTEAIRDLGAGDLSGHITRHATERRGHWLHTHGMTKFGQPDLQITLPEPALTRPADDLVLAVAKALVTGGKVIEGPTALDVPGWGRIALVGGRGRHFDGPVYTPMLEGDDPRRLTKTLALLDSRLDPDEDTIIQIQTGDEAMAAAVAEARRTLPEIIERYPDPMAARGQRVLLAVKVGFPLDEPSEFLWLTVEDWGEPVVGRVANEVQHVPDLARDQRVTFAREQISDWALARADGSMEGNFTEAVLRGAGG